MTNCNPGERFIESIYAVFLWMLCIGLIDYLVASKFKGRYFCLHSIVNLAIIVPFTIKDIFIFFDNPIESGIYALENECSDNFGGIITNALHFYHIYSFNLKPIDYIHHIPAIIGCTCSFWWSYGAAWNAQIGLALMGIPGGIDYLLLTLCKEGKLANITEKYINKQLNLWLRCPFAIITSFCIINCAIYYPERYNGGINHRIFHIASGIHGMWNGIFFMERTVESYTKYKKLK